jgi:hypothetical protein
MDGGRVQERGVANLNPWVDLLKQKAAHASFRDYDSLPKSSAGISPSDGTQCQDKNRILFIEGSLEVELPTIWTIEKQR